MRRAALLVLAIAACRPAFDDRPSQIVSPRVLAVRGTPAEARPGEDVAFELLYATPDGVVADTRARWAFCDQPLPPGEPGLAPQSCLLQAPLAFADDAAAPTSPLPTTSCALFGPDPPASGERPRDPDATGGYYQPVRADVGVVLAIGAVRVDCGLADAPPDIVAEFSDTYEANVHPEIAVDELADVAHAGSDVTLTARWPASAAESFPVYDLEARALVTQRESIRVAWYATGGTFAEDHTGRTAADVGTSTTNVLTLPPEAGLVHVIVVARDARGGVAWHAVDLDVQP